MVSKIKNLHVCGLDKFIPPFIDFVRKELPEINNFFYTIGDKNRFSYENGEDSYHQKGKILGYIKLLGFMYAAEKIILHGLFNPRLVMLLALNPWLLKKCYWVIWGGDLYTYKLSERDLRWRFKEVFRKAVIKRMGNLVTYIEGDVELVREWYGATGKYHECIMYLSNVFQDYILPKFLENKTINIQVGNSGDPSNNHSEVLEYLRYYEERNLKIYAPLSYGDEKYTQSIITKGKGMFGEKFKPMTEFMPFSEYLKFLSKIDIAIFNHDRQQGMGNTICLLGMGKKVCIKNGTTQWRMLKGIGAKTYELDEALMMEDNSNHLLKNKKIIKEHFSFKTLRDQWRKVLS